jgi:hypothetical protein
MKIMKNITTQSLVGLFSYLLMSVCVILLLNAISLMLGLRCGKRSGIMLFIKSPSFHI